MKRKVDINMVLVNAAYVDSNDGLDIMMSRTVRDEDDLRMVIGEVLYGIEVQCHTFDTDRIFHELSIPKSFKTNCTLANVEIMSGVQLTVTLTGKRLGSGKVRGKAVV